MDGTIMMSVASISEAARRASTGIPLTNATLPRRVPTISMVKGGSAGIALLAMVWLVERATV